MSIIRKTLLWMHESIFRFITIISPKLNTQLRYYELNKKFIDFKSPKSFTEKLSYLKLYNYNNNPLVKQCADKYCVRDYVKKCGLGHLLINLIDSFNSPSEICFDDLPDSFVLKMNFGAGMNIIVPDKKQMNQDLTCRKLKKWFRNKYWLAYSELQYNVQQKKIICEEFLSLENSTEKSIPDFKVYCFNGQPKAILVMHDRSSGLKTEFFDVSWNELENTKKYPSPKEKTKKPICLSEMIHAATVLSKPFPFVRCDFYVCNEKLYFGELTFTPAGGLYVSQCQIDGKDMSELLCLGKNNE